ncbi:hypothetical protein J4G33_15890 [Actinotalea sp. BY-33]|uniref:Uncharacterized protein n=1 Tax=Actinotalea soli TaxID=2819234 RepID=A0A939LUM6_9CELL|nr:hypothetical protein [Actinotalea soli]MBO1753290.1 hypothetical protein [Actinotalea soli]
MATEDAPLVHDERDGESASIDRRLLAVYLNDHLAGSVAGARRLRRTADTLQRSPVAAGLDRVAREVAAEKDELDEMLEAWGVTQALPKQALAWLGERVSRIKAARSQMRSSPTTTLLEVELLRSAVVGKRGLWQTLIDLAPALDVDRSRMVELLEQTDRQVIILDEVHAFVRVRALRAVR